MIPADDRVAERDPAIRGLRTVLDPVELRQRIDEVPVEDLRATYVRYKAGTSCLVAYRGLINGAETHFYARAQAHDADDKLPADPAGDPSDDPQRWSLPLRELDVALFAWGFDRRLRGARRLADKTARERLLKRVLPDGPDRGDPEISVLRYKPERRVVATVEWALGERAALKVHSQSAWRAADDAAKGFESQPPLRVATQLGRSSRHRVAALEWLEGEPLERGLATGAAENFALVGEALASLHDQPSLTLSAESVRDEARAVEAAASAVAAICPELGADAREAATEIAGNLTAPLESRPIHGDFTPDQVRIDGETVVILDLDRAAIGDPTRDVATFRAALELSVARGEIDRERAVAVVDQLCEGYERRAKRDTRPSPPAVAAALIKLAPLPFRERAPEWAAETEQLVRRARESLDRE